MANQIYRGNSEQKLYEIINNFVGGMNTVNVDEATSPNEFRELVNVDLTQKGLLQNRKGFKHMDLLEEFFSENIAIYNLLKKPIHYIEIIRDDLNLFQTLKGYTNLDTFKNDFASTPYQFQMLVVTASTNPNRLDFDVVLVLHDGTGYDDEGLYIGDWFHYPTVYTLNQTLYGVPRDIKVTGVRPSYLGNLIYIPTSQLIVGGNQIVEITRDASDYIGEPDLRIRLIDNNANYYETTPFDILDEGYNVLAANPLLNIKKQGSIESIQGITLVKFEGDVVYPLDTIPTDGNFSVLVMFTGDLDPANLQERLYFYNISNTAVDLVKGTHYTISLNDTNLGDGVMVFNYQLSKLENQTVDLHIEYNVVASGDVTPVETFATETDLVNFYNFAITTKYYTTLAAAPFLLEYVSSTQTRLMEKTNPYTYVYVAEAPQTAVAPSTIGTFTYYSSLGTTGTVYKYYGTIFAKIIYNFAEDGTPLPKTFYEYYQWNGTAWVSSTSTAYSGGTFRLEFEGLKKSEAVQLMADYADANLGDYPSSTTGVVIYLSDVTIKTDLQRYIPANLTGLIYVTATDDSYIWDGSTSGTIDDFTVATASNYSLSQYTAVYQFGNSDNLQPLESLNLTDVKATAMQDRLVLYKGNTIWWSVYGNPNYFPYKNYVNLPLLGVDEIVSINYFRGSYIVFTKERLFRISGVFPDISIVLLNDSIGCIAEGSIRAFNNTLVFLTYDGLYRVKQNFYMDGLENVEKIDKNVSGYFPRDAYADSFTYNEQYFLLFKDNIKFDTLRYYYNIDLPYEQHPYTVDKYAVKPDNLFKHNGVIYSVKNGTIYTFDEGYTDFLLSGTSIWTEQQIKDATYKVTIKTVNLMLGYPTHDKKFKNLFIKTHTLTNVPLSITVFTNDLLVIDPHFYRTQLSITGETEYIVDDVPNITTTTGTSLLGQFILGISKLGKLEMNVHKMPLATKGKYVQFIIEQETPAYFGIQDIGIVYKLNKIRAYQ